MPRYKLSSEEQAIEQERKENLLNIMKDLDVKNFDDLKDVFKLKCLKMVLKENLTTNSVILNMITVAKKVKIAATATPKGL